MEIASGGEFDSEIVDDGEGVLCEDEAVVLDGGDFIISNSKVYAPPPLRQDDMSLPMRKRNRGL